MPERTHHALALLHILAERLDIREVLEPASGALVSDESRASELLGQCGQQSGSLPGRAKPPRNPRFR